MNYYYRRNGKLVDVLVINEDGKKEKIKVDNYDNINQLLENENRLSKISKYAAIASKKYNRLVNERNKSKLINKISIGLGIIVGVLFKCLDITNIGILPYLLGSACAIIPMVKYKTFRKISDYNNKHDKLKREKDFYVDELNKERELRSKLTSVAKKETSYDDTRALGYSIYEIKYKDSKAVKYMKQLGFTDEEINSHFSSVKREIESMQRYEEEKEKTSSLTLTKHI